MPFRRPRGFSYPPPVPVLAFGDAFNRGLVSWHRMEANDRNGANTTIVDWSGNRNTLTLAVAPTLGPGKVGGALVLNGTTQYATAANAMPSGAAVRTVMGWIKTTNTGGQVFYGSGSAGTSNVFAIGSGFSTGGVVYFVGYGDDFQGNATLSDGVWHHVGVTYDGTNLRIYVDGRQDSTTTKTLNTASTGLAVGTAPWNVGGNFLAGSVDEVRMFTRVLAASEFAQIYGSTSGNLGIVKPRRRIVSGSASANRPFFFRPNFP